MTLFSLILCEATRVVDLMGEVGVLVFLLGGWTLAPRGNLKIRKSNSNSSSLSHITSALNLFLRVLEGHDNQHSQGMTRGRLFDPFLSFFLFSLFSFFLSFKFDQQMLDSHQWFGASPWTRPGTTFGNEHEGWGLEREMIKRVNLAPHNR